MTELIYEYNRGVIKTDQNMTIAECLETWLIKYKKSSIKRKTYEDYLYLSEKCITPKIN